LPIYKETLTQITILEWLHWQHPEVRKHVIKIRNEGAFKGGGLFTAIQAGLHIGASDFFVAYPSNGYHGAWIEVKPDGWKLTKKEERHHKEQMEFIKKMRLQKYFAEMIVGVDEGINALKLYLMK